MIDVVFSNSAEGALRYAQGWGQGPYPSACVGFAFAGNKQPPQIVQWFMRYKYQRDEKKKWKNAVVLSGNGTDVFALALGLSMGDIALENFWENRQNFFLERELVDVPAEYQEQVKKDILQRKEKIQNNLDQIYSRAMAGEPIRIWIGTSSEDRCMLAWFAAQLQDRNLTPTKIYLNELPERYNLPQGGAVQWNDWAEVSVEKWGVLDRELRRKAPEDFLWQQADIWHRLQCENTGLRITENGELRSVPQDYYDDLIRAEIDRQPEEFLEAHLIGTLIGTQLRMPDTWIAERIEMMIAAGQLLITWEEKPGSRSYRRRLKKVC